MTQGLLIFFNIFFIIWVSSWLKLCRHPKTQESFDYSRTKTLSLTSNEDSSFAFENKFFFSSIDLFNSCFGLVKTYNINYFCCPLAVFSGGFFRQAVGLLFNPFIFSSCSCESCRMVAPCQGIYLTSRTQQFALLFAFFKIQSV